MLDILTIIWSHVELFLNSHPFLRDGTTLFLSGALLEGARRLVTWAISAFYAASTLTVRISEADDSYLWLHSYLSDNSMKVRPGQTDSPTSFWVSVLELIYPTGRCPPRDVTVQATPLRDPHLWHWQMEEKMREKQDIMLGKLKLRMTPSTGQRQAIRFKNHILRYKFYEIKNDNGFSWAKNWIEISCLFATHELFQSLVEQARQEYLLRDESRIAIYTPRGGGRGGEGSWSKTIHKPFRPWKSVVLPAGVKESILEDASDFINEESFYRRLGLPYRRGYLLHGPPGSGKSSLILALASHLKLDVYYLALGSKDLDDGALQSLMASVSSRSILLIEDIDCAMKDRKAEDEKEEDEKKDDHKESEEGKGSKGKGSGGSQNKSGSSITLSGLLNALDGVTAGEGRLLFCTTNHLEKIDDALSRPGRCDVWIPYANAIQSQAKELFLRFYEDSGEASNPAAITDSPETEKARPDGHVSLSPADLDDMATSFSKAIPNGQVSMSALQSYLMRFKRRPRAAMDSVSKWADQGFKQTLL
ncbi:P-loop containing nucleoside triphosphate hydrolase protein [Kockovaella imperatae]|uniref:p-loop containing nucleoside triphosphate hydrolase protein n=1 Tax=Kockovaella imperatae TaxID=4999 RepID=A0A1Y1U8X6_9TREE|nr:P-loop containing nucleoside triphosphate hydrolase protein [Kockovaella imperatae]ORX33946.1 P-loop containing nucleoside triphosphate hydrolase protein [Kockovaella imperatae]